MEKRVTKITQDKTQTRSTIPNKFVKIKKISKKDKIEWILRGKKLIGVLVNEDSKDE